MARKPKLKRVDPNQTAFDFVERCEDLPLFSGTPMRVPDAAFRPQPVARQPRLFGPVTLEELQEAEAQRKRKQ